MKYGMARSRVSIQLIFLRLLTLTIITSGTLLNSVRICTDRICYLFLFFLVMCFASSVFLLCFVFFIVQLARDALIVHGPLAHRLGVHQLRNELETVAFRRLFPDQFHEVGAWTS